MSDRLGDLQLSAEDSAFIQRLVADQPVVHPLQQVIDEIDPYAETIIITRNQNGTISTVLQNLDTDPTLFATMLYGVMSQFFYPGVSIRAT